MVNSSPGVHIAIAVYQFAMLYGRSQSNSTTRSSDNDLSHSGLRIRKRSRRKLACMPAYLCRYFHLVIYLWRIGMLIMPPGEFTWFIEEWAYPWRSRKKRSRIVSLM